MVTSYTCFKFAQFILWANSKRTVPTWQEISDRYDVSRATAYRWREHFADAKGVPLPEDIGD